MQSRGLNQSQLAEEIGTDARKVGMLLRRDSKKSELVQRAAERYGIPLEWFYTDDQDPVPTSDSSTIQDRPTTTHGNKNNGPQLLNQGPEIGRSLVELDREIADIVSLWMKIPEKARGRYIRQIVEEAIKNDWFDTVPDALLAKWSAREEIDRLKKKPPPGTQ